MLPPAVLFKAEPRQSHSRCCRTAAGKGGKEVIFPEVERDCVNLNLKNNSDLSPLLTSAVFKVRLKPEREKSKKDLAVLGTEITPHILRAHQKNDQVPSASKDTKYGL